MSGEQPPDDTEIYEYIFSDTIYAMNWSRRPDQPFRLAIGSFIEDYTNSIRVIQLNEGTASFRECCAFDHPYPATKIMWIPDTTGAHEDLVATSGDYLRIWQVPTTPGHGKTKPKCLLDNNKNAEFKFCAPLTSFDWNEFNPNIIGTSSIDTTCTIWDVETQQVKTQVIAHDAEVYDIGFQTRHPDIFASVGADGSLRTFDLRNLDQSTILYENPGPQHTPLLRLAWNKQDEHYIATIGMDCPSCYILDTRYPAKPAAELQGHHGATINSLAWAPHSACHITTAGDDKQALIWDLSPFPNPIQYPSLAYRAGGEINQLQWSAAHPSWIAITFSNYLQLLRV